MDVYEDVIKSLDRDKLYYAIQKLKPHEQKLIHKLYLDRQPMTQEQYANYLGIKVKSVQEKSRRIRKKLQILIKKQWL